MWKLTKSLLRFAATERRYLSSSGRRLTILSCAYARSFSLEISCRSSTLYLERLNSCARRAASTSREASATTHSTTSKDSNSESAEEEDDEEEEVAATTDSTSMTSQQQEQQQQVQQQEQQQLTRRPPLIRLRDQWMKARLKSGEMRYDEHQAEVARRLQNLQQVLHATQYSNAPLREHRKTLAALQESQDLLEIRKHRMRHSPRDDPATKIPKGAYISGGVGTGKSMLMDAFYDLVTVRKRGAIIFTSSCRTSTNAFTNNASRLVNKCVKPSNSSSNTRKTAKTTKTKKTTTTTFPLLRNKTAALFTVTKIRL